MEYFIVSALNGLIYGLLLFMVSAGLTLVFGMMGVVNFAHASFYMLGAYFGYALTKYVDFFVGLLVAPFLVALVGMLIERYLLRFVSAAGHMHQLLLTFGIIYIIQEIVNLFFGRFAVSYQIPAVLQFSAFSIYETNYPFYRLLMGMIALGMFVLIFALLRWTRVGIIVRAAVQRPMMVEALGHNIEVISTGVFSAGAWLAGLAGAVGGAFYVTNPNLGLEMGIIVFVVVVVGGLGSLGGALVASLIIGLLTSFSVGFDWSLADLARFIGWSAASQAGGLMELKLSTLAGSMPIFLMLLVLLIRPAGLMGEKQ